MADPQRGVYRIRNLITGDVYIGSSIDIRARLARHRSELRVAKHRNERLQRAWQKYGPDAFAFEVLEELGEAGDEALVAAELAALDAARPQTYNIAIPGRAPTFQGYRHTEAAKAAMRAARLGKRMSAESKALVGAASRARPHTPEAVAKMRAGLTGQHRSPEAIENYRAAWPPERRQAQAAVARRVNLQRGRQ